MVGVDGCTYMCVSVNAIHIVLCSDHPIIEGEVPNCRANLEQVLKGKVRNGA